jgi:signal transduction histidine kinase/DNA-binding NarL/FixJ family response regulator
MVIHQQHALAVNIYKVKCKVCRNSLKQVKLLVGFLILCVFIMENAIAAPTDNIVSFNLSHINNHNISEKVNYFSLKDNATLLPNELNQLDAWLSTLASHQITSALGDKYVVAFEIYNDTQLAEWFVYPYGSVIQSIDILFFSSDNLVSSFQTGHGLKNQQDFHYGSEFKILPGQRKTLLMNFNSDFFLAPVKILVKPKIQAQQRFQLENVILLLSLGICFALGVYHLFIFFSTRNKQHIYYALATLAHVVGWASVFGVPEYVGIGKSDHWFMPAFLIGIFFSCFFNIQFLRLEESAPQAAKTFKVISWVTLATLPFTFYSQGIGLYLTSVLSSGVLIIGLYSGIRCWLNGYSPAKYFVFGLLSVLVPNMVGNLMHLGVIPGLSMNIYLLGLIGNSLDSLLLAVALAAQLRLLTLENTVEKRTTELRQANFQLEQMNSDLIEASNAKGQFLATMCHEIRTPLTSIMGYADGILMGDIDKAEQDRVTKIIAENSNHLLSVINDILDISKIEANKLDFESIPTPLFSVLTQIESVVGKRAQDKGLDFHLEYEYPLPALINTDPTRLKQILFNLTNNAIKFTEQGYVRLSVSLVDNHLQIKVKDSGEGISVQHKEQLFQPFTQADSSINRRFGGSGLGLSISRRLANGLGGDIIVESTPSKGSTFTLNIDLFVVNNSPWINNAGEISQSTPTQSLTPVTLPNFEGKKVLLADNHPNNRELIAILLKRMNITVTEVENGKQALETILYQKFDLILLDIHMPIMDGTEALKQIRAAGNFTPVIALTANNMKHEIEHYIRLGFSEHLAKPISRVHFINQLSLYLSKQGNTDNPLQQTDMLKLIKDYQQNLCGQLISLQQALDQCDLTVISEIAHTIKGSAGSFGFDIIGHKFAVIEHHALKGDQKTVTDELPKVMSLVNKCIDLPGVDIAKGIVKYDNNAENFFKAIFQLVEHSQQTLMDLIAALGNKEMNSARVHLYKFYPATYDCALIQSESAFNVLDLMIKQGNPESQQYTPQLDIIHTHFAELKKVLAPDFLNEI